MYHGGNYVKDLNKLGRDLQKIVIVDNSPASYIFHPENAVSSLISISTCTLITAFLFLGASEVLVRRHVGLRAARLDSAVREAEQGGLGVHDLVQQQHEL